MGKAFLQKPRDNAELLALIRQALGESALEEKPALDVLGSFSPPLITWLSRR
jgi:hypothetical protein